MPPRGPALGEVSSRAPPGGGGAGGPTAPWGGGDSRPAGEPEKPRRCRAGARHDELGPVPRDPAGLVLLADHEARDVLEEEERHVALARELDEVRTLLRGLG